jgi:hypothetical protein
MICDPQVRQLGQRNPEMVRGKPHKLRRILARVGALPPENRCGQAVAAAGWCRIDDVDIGG